MITCILCNGSGRTFDPSTPRDPIEGNKMRNSLPCELCNGNKIIDINQYLTKQNIVELHHEMLMEGIASMVATKLTNQKEDMQQIVINTLKDIVNNV